MVSEWNHHLWAVLFLSAAGFLSKIGTPLLSMLWEFHNIKTVYLFPPPSLFYSTFFSELWISPITSMSSFQQFFLIQTATSSLLERFAAIAHFPVTLSASNNTIGATSTSTTNPRNCFSDSHSTHPHAHLQASACLATCLCIHCVAVHLGCPSATTLFAVIASSSLLHFCSSFSFIFIQI